MSSYPEDHLVEQPAIEFMQHELGWEVANREIDKLLKQGVKVSFPDQEQDRQPDGGVGAFRRLEEGDERGGRGGISLESGERGERV